MPTVFCNGRIRTLGPSGVVSTMLVDDAGTIVATGADVQSHPMAAVADRCDLGGRTVLPGPVDAHDHLLWLAHDDLRAANLVGCDSLDELLARLAAHRERRPDGWLTGYGFDHERFPDAAFPTRADLDRVSTTRPIVVSRVCGHAIAANSRALELAGVSSDTGILTEERMDPVYAAIPEPTVDEWVDIARHGIRLLAAGAFTGAHVLVNTPAEVAAFQRLRAQGELTVRIRLQIPYRLLKHLKAVGLMTGLGDEWLRIGSIKLFSDGSMGARTAALTTDYADEPGNRGELIHPRERLAAMVRDVHDSGCQVCVHAIGDDAMDATMDAIIAASGSGTRAARHRIEHASITRPDQIRRLAETGIVTCVQPQFTVTDFWTVSRLGEERKGWIYPFASMLREGVILAGGTDAPVERLSSLEAVGRAVTRDAPWRGEAISRGHVPGECLSVEQAWRVFAEGSAYAGFAEGRFGALEPSKACDFIALDGDPWTADPKSLETMEPAMVVTGGVRRV